MVKAGEWNEEKFRKDYVPVFLSDFKANNEAIRSLNELFDIGRTRNIHCVCFCNDEKICHRSIIKGFLQGGQKKEGLYNIVEDNVDYSYYYNFLEGNL